VSADGHVQIKDFSDREILLMMLDLGGEVSTPDLAARIYGWSGPDYEDTNSRVHGHRCTSGRLVWMRRYGLVTRDDDGLWDVTAPGKTMVGFTLPNVVESTMMRMSDSADLVLANRLGERLVKAGEITGTAMRRELQFHITRRKRK
jgi:hypothetical protein